MLRAHRDHGPVTDQAGEPAAVDCDDRARDGVGKIGPDLAAPAGPSGWSHTNIVFVQVPPFH
jgi:hypothetical protein